MDDEDKTLRERALFCLKHQIRPAEEVDALRRQMAHRLAKSLGKERLGNPLTLVDADTVVTPSEDLTPAQREFVDAVQKSVELQAEFSRLQEDHRAAASSMPAAERAEDKELEERILRLQLRKAGLREKIDRYKVAIKHIEQLRQQPAAAPDFLDPAVMFRDCDPLPEMPPELMASFTFDKGASQNKIQELYQRLKKERLRQQILVQQEKRKYEEARARNPVDPATVPPEIQVQALNAVKDALIQWIETHLSKAGDGEDESDPVSSPEQPRKAEREEYDHEARLAEIQREYDRHIELRKEILGLIAYHEKMTQEWSRVLKEQQQKRENVEPAEKEEAPPARAASAATATASLITPYIEKLQAIARDQKGLAHEKSHINATLAKHQQETQEMLGHLREESQLLAKFPSAASTGKRDADFGEATRAAAAKEPSSVTSLLEPWLLAADAAKLATLETVAEKVEEGQMAVDEAMGALDEARKPLNKEAERDEGDDSGGQDASGGAAGDEKRGASARKITGKSQKSIYAKLDGKLGLINE
ncbi:hypothetical protein DL766_005259 [Monosporascus sp. MC13-8B]|uniref:Uncharacterized protein n=1 Tax=Monosporascus cannonballus TaxID=155416 RepID=A0ABY0HCA0_9PEZI|nr:hypothetical protein DL762_004458 [Monosporascus cannonballus]RYO87883.1 hypothetical protein DL763_006189 [Monosporascus cannonballus]RYP29629.1 hypothetical protein DL766_005259 [Monosporascus sp. MC13-8B]